MTLDVLETVERQLLEQQRQLPATSDPSKPTVMHMNFIELAGALQLIKQLIVQEKVILAAPPGATGPAL